MDGYKLCALGEDGKRTVFTVGNVKIGEDFTVIAGPCSVESKEQIELSAALARQAGADILRGGTFKMRTSPYSFQGLGEEGLKLLRDAGEKYSLPVITEVTDTRDVDMVCQYADIIQIGARNMENYALLSEVGKHDVPVLLKRGSDATIEEFLESAEYILKEGNEKVILCERGVKTFGTYTRNTLDLSCVAALKTLTHLPVFADPSHATGRRELVKPMSLAAEMAGCDGLEIEMHPSPDEALSDAQQQLSGPELAELLREVRVTAVFRDGLDLY